MTRSFTSFTRSKIASIAACSILASTFTLEPNNSSTCKGSANTNRRRASSGSNNRSNATLFSCAFLLPLLSPSSTSVMIGSSSSSSSSTSDEEIDTTSSLLHFLELTLPSSSSSTTSSPSRLLATSASKSYHHHDEEISLSSINSCTRKRTYKTKTDIFFQQNKGCIPKPKQMHVHHINDLIQNDNRISGYYTSSSHHQSNNNNNTNNVLIIGDVHGCYNELKSLVQKASIEYNNNQPFRCIILVGDLCNKGPHSSKVIKFVKEQKYWYTVRGNHDDGALRVALGDVKRKDEKKYAWITSSIKNCGDNHDDGVNDFGDDDILSDDDVEWLANIPYTITIPKSFWVNNVNNDDGSDENSSNSNSYSNSKNSNGKNILDQDVVIVHAGLIPNIPIESQEIKTMVVVRDVVLKTEQRTKPNEDDHMGSSSSSGSSSSCSQSQEYEFSSSPSSSSSSSQPWAKAWNGPQLVIFGHDAKRGYQNESHAIGLDTGCVYGKQLSGIILPRKEIVNVDAEKVHCPIGKSK